MLVFFFLGFKGKAKLVPLFSGLQGSQRETHFALCFFFWGGPLKKTCSNCTMSSIQWPAKVGRLSARFLLTNQRLRVGFTLAALLGS